jgi:hypothetical protein
LAALALAFGGCDEDIAADLADLSGAFMGEVVSVTVTACLYDALGIEDAAAHDEHAAEEAHAHNAQPLHDHEH